MKLTTETIERKCSQILTNKSLSKTIKKDVLCTLTHLYMSDMFITSIGNFDICKNLKVIYLHNNNISKIKNLNFACNLTHLYLQHNAITKIENLEALQNLQKLYLGYNNIIVVEGLENASKLKELHIENQKIPIGESLCFEPRSISTLSISLNVLNISNNKLASLRNLTGFHELHILIAKNNLIDNMDDLTTTISTLTSLRYLFLQGNPVTRFYRYRENLIANSVSVVNLDEKIVTDVCRNFMKKFRKEKHNRHLKEITKTPLRDDITSSLNLPPAFKRSITRAIFQPPEPQLSITITPGLIETQLQVFSTWKSASSIRSTRNNHVIPRPFWGKVTKNKETRKRSFIDTKSITLPAI